MRLHSIVVLSLAPWFGVSSSSSSSFGRVTRGGHHDPQREITSSSSSSRRDKVQLNPVLSHSNQAVPLNVLYNRNSNDGRKRSSGLRKPSHQERDFLLHRQHDKLLVNDDDKKETTTNHDKRSSSTVFSSSNDEQEKNDNADVGILATSDTTRSTTTKIEDTSYDYYYKHGDDSIQTSQRNLALTADPSSCNSSFPASCVGAGFEGTATVGIESCNADYACSGMAFYYRATAVIGDSSCNAEWACRDVAFFGRGTTVVHDNSCNAGYACFAVGAQRGADVIIYEDSCNAPRACYLAGEERNAYARIGRGSCNGYQACLEIAHASLIDSVRAVVGEESCNGEYSCNGSSVSTGTTYIGDRSCLGESSCAFQSNGNFTIGNDSCSCDGCCQDLDPGSVIGDCQCNDPCYPCTGYINNPASACTGSLPDPEDREKACPSSAPSLSSAPSSPPSDSAFPSYSGSPSQRPSESPSRRPSESPSLSASPSDVPSTSSAPTSEPTSLMAPSQSPSQVPTANPSTEPTASAAPSELASATPSQSISPSHVPSSFPSESPTSAPLVCGSSFIPGNAYLALECCDSATNAVGPKCCGTTPYNDALEQCCVNSLSVISIGDDCPSSSAPKEWCSLGVNDGCGGDEILTCTKHLDTEKDDYHFHEECTKEKDLVGVHVGDFVDNDRQLAACGCCLDDPMILQEVDFGNVDLKVAKSTKTANCPEPNLIL